VAVTDIQKDIVSDGLTTATTTYASGDCLDNVHTASGFASANGGTGVITAHAMVDDGDVLGAITIYVYDTTISVTDNSAFAPSDADADNYVGRIDIPPPDDLGANRAAWTPCWVPFKCTGSSTSLFFIAVTRTANAVFAATDDLHLRFLVTQTS